MSRQPAVYIMASNRNGTLYISVARHLAKRVWEHKNDLVEGFTKRHGVHKLAYYETCDDMTSGVTREKQLEEVSSKSVYTVRRCTLCLNNTGSRPERGDTPPMRKESTGSRSESRPEWEQLEDWVRSQVQRLIQELLEEEVTEFLGRAKSALRSDSDSDTGYRNGYGRARRLTLSSGTIQLRRPRVRDTEEQFESRLLPLFVNRTRKIAELIPELYLHGLSEGDFDLALRGLLGEDAPVSASTVARLKSKWNDELAQWRSRPLDDLEVVYMWVDGVYVKAGLEKEKAAVLVVMAALSDGSKVVVSAVPGYRESTESWSEVLRDIKRRGLSCPRLVVGDGHLGIWGALRNVYPQAAEQRCWNHKIVNVLAKLDSLVKTRFEEVPAI